MHSSKLTIKLLRWLLPRLNFPLLVLNGWVLLQLVEYFKTPLTILIVGAVIAFLLEHPLQWMERHGIKRVPAILLIVISLFVLLCILGVTLFPILSKQSHALISTFPTWEQSANQQVQTLHEWMQSLGIPINFSGLITNLSDQLSGQLRQIATRLPGFLEGAIGSVFEFFLIAVVIVYLLLKGEALWNGIIEWLPIRSVESRYKTSY